MRPSKIDYYLNIAKAVSKRSTCLRRQYGAVLVKNDEIIATGYNGSPRGEANCVDTNNCTRQQLNIPHGERYELCTSVHAEMNAIISASRSEMLNADLYLYGYDLASNHEIEIPSPCTICERLIKNAGIRCVITQGTMQFFDGPEKS